MQVFKLTEIQKSEKVSPFFLELWYQDSDPGPGFIFKFKCSIRIRTKWMPIRNPHKKAVFRIRKANQLQLRYGSGSYLDLFVVNEQILNYFWEFLWIFKKTERSGYFLPVRTRIRGSMIQNYGSPDDPEGPVNYGPTASGFRTLK